MDNIGELEKRIKALEELCHHYSDLHMADFKDGPRLKAERLALLSIVMEITLKLGVPVGVFHEHYKIRTKWWLHHEMLNLEKQDAGFAAELDDRPATDLDFPGKYPPIF